MYIIHIAAWFQKVKSVRERNTCTHVYVYMFNYMCINTC